jgi:malate dehydrogenase (oxaloacetate-decarboxylating)(NADP+)
MNGAGSAGQAVMKFMQSYGFDPDKCIMCDTKGVIYKGRKKGMNPYKARFQTNDD